MPSGRHQGAASGRQRTGCDPREERSLVGRARHDDRHGGHLPQPLTEGLERGPLGAGHPASQQHVKADVSRGAEQLEERAERSAEGRQQALVVVDHQNMVRPRPSVSGLEVGRRDTVGGHAGRQCGGQVLGLALHRCAPCRVGHHVRAPGEVQHGPGRVHQVQAHIVGRSRRLEVGDGSTEQRGPAGPGFAEDHQVLPRRQEVQLNGAATKLAHAEQEIARSLRRCPARGLGQLGDLVAAHPVGHAGHRRSPSAAAPVHRIVDCLPKRQTLAGRRRLGIARRNRRLEVMPIRGGPPARVIGGHRHGDGALDDRLRRVTEPELEAGAQGIEQLRSYVEPTVGGDHHVHAVLQTCGGELGHDGLEVAHGLAQQSDVVDDEEDLRPVLPGFVSPLQCPLVHHRLQLAQQPGGGLELTATHDRADMGQIRQLEEAASPEIEAVELHVVRAPPSGKSENEGAQQRGLAGAGRAGNADVPARPAAVVDERPLRLAFGNVDEPGDGPDPTSLRRVLREPIEQFSEREGVGERAQPHLPGALGRRGGDPAHHHVEVRLRAVRPRRCLDRGRRRQAERPHPGPWSRARTVRTPARADSSIRP